TALLALEGLPVLRDADNLEIISEFQTLSLNLYSDTGLGEELVAFDCLQPLLSYKHLQTLVVVHNSPITLQEADV
ncbi:hypothetical protein FRB98_001317, partial [Tulasnella sp. 332]